MIRLILKGDILSFLLPCLICIGFASGCRSKSAVSVPDAPPPYASFSVPQERYQTAQVYGGQPNLTSPPPPYIPPQSDPPSNITFNPAISLPPPNNPRVGELRPYRSTNNFSNRRTSHLQKSNNTIRYTLVAKNNLWVLVQDPKGTELDWIKMKAGDSKSISHKGALTITCSSGNQLTIKDKNGKTLETNPNMNGISIVRLPGD